MVRKQCQGAIYFSFCARVDAALCLLHVELSFVGVLCCGLCGGGCCLCWWTALMLHGRCSLWQVQTPVFIYLFFFFFLSAVQQQQDKREIVWGFVKKDDLTRKAERHAEENTSLGSHWIIFVYVNCFLSLFLLVGIETEQEQFRFIDHQLHKYTNAYS